MDIEVKALTIELLETMGETDAVMNQRRMSGPAYAFIVDGTTKAALGLGLVCGREFFAWAVIREEVKASQLLMRRLCKEIKVRYPVIRDLIKAEVISAETWDNDSYCRFLERLLNLHRLPIARYGWNRAEG